MSGQISGSNQAPITPQHYDSGRTDSVEKTQKQSVSAGYQQENTISHITGKKAEGIHFKPILETPSTPLATPTLVGEVKSIKESSKSDLQAIGMMRLANTHGDKLSTEQKGQLGNMTLQLMSAEKMPESALQSIQQGINSLQKALGQEDLNPAEMDSLMMELEVAFTNNKSELQESFQEHAKQKMETVRKLAQFLNHLIDDSHDSRIGGEWRGDRINQILESYGLEKLSPSEVKEFQKLAGEMESRRLFDFRSGEDRQSEFMEGMVKLLFNAMDLPLPSNLEAFTEKMIESFSKDYNHASMYAPNGGVDATDDEIKAFEDMMRGAIEGAALADTFQEMAMQYQGKQIRKNLRIQNRI